MIELWARVGLVLVLSGAWSTGAAAQVSIECVGAPCERPEYGRAYQFRVVVVEREALVGLTAKLRDTAAGRTLEGDACLGEFRPTVGSSRWPEHRGGASWPCRVSLPRDVDRLTWRAPACGPRSRLKVNLKAEWRDRPNAWADAYLDVRGATCGGSGGSGGGSGSGSGAAGEVCSWTRGNDDPPGVWHPCRVRGDVCDCARP